MIAGHFPSWSRIVYIQWLQHQRLTFLLFTLVKWNYHRLLDVTDMVLSQRSCDYRNCTATSKAVRQHGLGWGVEGSHVHKVREQRTVRKGHFEMVTTELSAERGAGAHLAGRRQRHMKQQEAFKLLWLLQCSRKGRQRDIVPWRQEATEAHM